MTDQVTTPEAGEQSQETTSEVENLATETAEHTEVTEQQEQAPQQKTVPLAALHEERREKKELREKMRTMEERFGQLAQVVSQRLQPQQKEPEIPDLNADPVGHFRARNEMLERQLHEQGRTTQEIQQALQAQAAYQQASAHVQGQVSEFAASKPDFHQAVEHVQQADYAALLAIGHEPAQAAQMVRQYHDQLVMSLLRQGANVPERIYALAEAKGYKAAQQTNEQERLQGLKKGVGASKSLGSGGGVTQKLSLAALADMPADEFAKTIGDEEAWRKLWG